MSTVDRLSLPAGRELDAEVAEKVFGWSNCEWDGWQWFGTASDGLLDCPIPAYTSDITDVWQVVQLIHDRWKGEVRITLEFSHDQWACKIVALTGHGTLANVTAETAPLAICRAALLAAER